MLIRRLSATPLNRQFSRERRWNQEFWTERREAGLPNRGQAAFDPTSHLPGDRAELFAERRPAFAKPRPKRQPVEFFDQTFGGASRGSNGTNRRRGRVRIAIGGQNEQGFSAIWTDARLGLDFANPGDRFPAGALHLVELVPRRGRCRQRTGYRQPARHEQTPPGEGIGGNPTRRSNESLHFQLSRRRLPRSTPPANNPASGKSESQAKPRILPGLEKFSIRDGHGLGNRPAVPL